MEASANPPNDAMEQRLSLQTAANGEARHYPEDYEDLTHLLRWAAERHGVEVDVVSRRLTVFSDGHRSLTMVGPTLGSTPFYAREALRRKGVAKVLMQRAGVRVAASRAFALTEIEAAWNYGRQRGDAFVVKPATGIGGKGVTTNIRTRTKFDAAWKEVSAVTKGEVMVEEFVPGFDHRFLVIGNMVRAVLKKHPLHVVGDGASTVRDLIERRRLDRMRNPFTRRKALVLQRSVHQTMREAGVGLESVLPEGTLLQLDTVGNLRRGGESEDVPVEHVHVGFLEAAIKAKDCVSGVEFCGIDIIASDAAQSPSTQPWIVCEINTNPDFAMHLFPSAGAPRDIPAMLFSYAFCR